MPAKSPLLKNSIHLALAASISAFWANAGALIPTTNAITNAMLRMINSLGLSNIPASLSGSSSSGHRLLSASKRPDRPYQAGRCKALGEDQEPSPSGDEPGDGGIF